MASIISRYGWHEWLAKTNFSFLQGANHPAQMVERAQQLGYGLLSINDFAGVYGLARSYLALKKLRYAADGPLPFRLGYGTELHLAKDHAEPVWLQDTLVLIPQTWQGYYHINQLIAYSHRDGKTAAAVDLADLSRFELSDVVAIVPMRGLLRQRGNGRSNRQQRLEQRYGAYKELFGERLHLAVSRLLHRAEDQGIKATLALSERLDIPVLLSQDAFFAAADDKIMSDLLAVIRSNSTMAGAAGQMFVNGERHLHTLAELEARYRDIPGYEAALRRSRELAESLSFDFSQLRYTYPKELIPMGHSSYSYLDQLVWQHAAERFDGRVPDRVSEQLSKELDLIKVLQFADYFLTVWDIVAFARRSGILCQGRGSAANSSICYVLGVTSVDPSRYDLLFERFISMERGDPPDIDVDFEHERREEVIQYVYDRFGRDRAAMVANVITYKAKGAMRAVGKALGISEATLTLVTKTVSTRYFRRSGASEVLHHFRQDLPEDSATAKELSCIPWQLWGEMAERLRGFPRHLGIHSGGFMLSDRSLNWLCPTEPATMPGRTVVPWCKEDIEGLGFFKIDLLSLGMLTALRKVFDLVSSTGGPKLALYDLPAHDKATFAMIQRAETVGVFQIESRAQMSMLPRMRPLCFYDLVIEVAIIRPGPIQGGVIHPYLRRRNGLDPVEFPDKRLESILARTLGIAIFQEQAMRIAIAVGGFTGGEANELRKKIGAWSIKDDKELKPWLDRLAAGMRRNGLSEEFTASLLGQMKGFAEYGFPESHAASFAFLAYASCYVKCHYPAAFFCGVLNAQPMGFYSCHALIATAKREGVTVLPISIHRSTWDHRLERRADGDHRLRLGFRLMAGLRQAMIERLVAARDDLPGGCFQSLEQICESVRLFRHDLTVLAAADVFKDLGISRKDALWFAQKAPLAELLEDVDPQVAFAGETPMERVEQDFAAFGTSLYRHPAGLMKEQAWPYDIPVTALTLSSQMLNQEPGRSVYVFGLILVRQAPPSAKGMVFLTIEDEEGFLNLAMAPPVYRKFHALVDNQSFLCVRAKVQRVAESHSLLVSRVFPADGPRATVHGLYENHTATEPQQGSWVAPRNYH